MHLADDSIEQFFAGTLAPADVEAFDAHLDACAPCRVLFSERIRARTGDSVALAGSSGPRLPVEVGEVVMGRYRIDRLVGLGGMGCVFEAHHLTLNQRVALKFLLPELAADSSAADRFVREARASVRLVTEHVGRVLDLGELDNGAPCLIMEFLDGETMEKRLSRDGPFAPEVAVACLNDVISGISAAHQLGIIHRDLKPANLFFARKPQGGEVLKVLDFGIAKSVHPDIEAGLGTTGARTLLGSPLYMAPEQLAATSGLTASVDVWAIGCTLFQMLTGVVPFEAKDLVELMYVVQNRPHLRVSKLAPRAAHLEPVVDACLQKDPAQRPPLEALSAMLEQAVPRPSRTRWVVGFVAVSVAAALAVVALTRPPEPSPATDLTLAPAPVLNQVEALPTPPPALPEAGIVEPTSPPPVPVRVEKPENPAPPRRKQVPPPATPKTPDEDPLEERF